MNFPKELRYTKTHEWAKKDGLTVTVGITDYAQKEISDVVFVELPKQGQAVTAGKPAAVVESVKAAFDIYSPVSGKVTGVNSAIEGDPGMVNQECYGKGWFFTVEMSSEAEWNALMDAGAYEKNLTTGV
ncbi:MAG: glycine cleavage system protein GcvH [Candidatus Omnitrophica bacterium]|nr:glycine cleavage system protein GcvH [Candidatus Omnitrophota bacterium]